MAERDTVNDERLRLGLIDLLQHWQRGEVTEEHVRDEAESLEFRWDGWPAWDALAAGDEPPHMRLLVDVATSLSSLHDTWVVQDDIPPMLDALELLAADPTAAERRWVDYRDSIDWEARGRTLHGHAFYLT